MITNNNDTSFDKGTGILTNNSRGVTIQKNETSYNIFLLAMVLLLFFLIEIGMLYWIVERENNLKKDFESYKVEVNNQLTQVHLDMTSLVNLYGSK